MGCRRPTGLGKMKRKVIIAVLIVFSLAAAIGFTYDSFRLAIIRATMRLPLPGWLQAIIWGW